MIRDCLKQEENFEGNEQFGRVCHIKERKQGQKDDISRDLLQLAMIPLSGKEKDVARSPYRRGPFLALAEDDACCGDRNAPARVH